MLKIALGIILSLSIAVSIPKVSLHLKPDSSHSAVQFKFYQQDFDWERSLERNSCLLSTCLNSLLPSRGLKFSKEEYFDLLGIIIFLLGENEQFLVEKGIFRISGTKSTVEALFVQLLSVIDSQSFCRLSDLEKVRIVIQGHNFHDLASLLKQLIQKSPFPLISLHSRRMIMEIVKFPGISPCKRREMCFASFGGEERGVLEDLFSFLSKVAGHSGLNLMTVHNLQIIFAAVLFDGGIRDAESLNLYIEAMGLLIQMESV